MGSEDLVSAVKTLDWNEEATCFVYLSKKLQMLCIIIANININYHNINKY